MKVALVVGKKRTIAAEKRQKKEQKEEAERHMSKQEQLVSVSIGLTRALPATASCCLGWLLIAQMFTAAPMLHPRLSAEQAEDGAPAVPAVPPAH